MYKNLRYSCPEHMNFSNQKTPMQYSPTVHQVNEDPVQVHLHKNDRKIKEKGKKKHLLP